MSVRADAQAMADSIAARYGDAVAAILFYGSCLRGDGGILDLYVLVDDLRTFHGPGWKAWANRILPPNVLYLPPQPGNDGAKVAVMTRDQFAARLRPTSLDTTIWARFCQPSRLLHARDTTIRHWVGEQIAQAVTTACLWAVTLGPTQGRPGDYWRGLFRHTYRVELRAERGGRADTVYDFAADRYDRLFPLAIGELGLDMPRDQDQWQSPAAARQSGWWRRRLAGKPLNLARLAKALFTFDGGIDYILGKIERHSGHRVALTPWQRRHPLLAAPGIILSLYREGAIR